MLTDKSIILKFRHEFGQLLARQESHGFCRVLKFDGGLKAGRSNPVRDSGCYKNRDAMLRPYDATGWVDPEARRTPKDTAGRAHFLSRDGQVV